MDLYRLPPGRVLLSWDYDRDICEPELPGCPIGLISDDAGQTWQRNTILYPHGGLDIASVAASG